MTLCLYFQIYSDVENFFYFKKISPRIWLTLAICRNSYIDQDIHFFALVLQAPWTIDQLKQ
jgi:hypothetical protein